MKKTIITAAAFALSAALTLTAHADSVLYSFTSGTAAPDTQPASFTAGNAAIGNSNGTVATPVASSSVSSGYTQVNGSPASGTFNLGNAVLTGAFNVATSSYYSFTLTASTGNQVQLSDFDFATRSTSTGPQAFALYTSVDNFTTALFTGTIGNNSTWVFNNNTIATPVTSTAGTMEVRLFTYGGAGNAAANTANSRVDDVTITASSIAVPEPATYAYVIAGLGALALGMRRRSVA